MGLSIRSVIVILIISALVGLLAIWFITNKLNPIIEGIHEFRKGNLSTRILVKNNGELDRIPPIQHGNRYVKPAEAAKNLSNLLAQEIHGVVSEYEQIILLLSGRNQQQAADMSLGLLKLSQRNDERIVRQ